MGQVEAAVLDAPPISTVIGANVFRFRVLRIPKMTQEDLAKRAGIALETLRRLEMSRDPSHKQLRPRVDTVESLAQALGVDFMDLITFVGDTRRYLHWGPSHDQYAARTQERESHADHAYRALADF